ncbi:MAG: sulfatase-like hydrolase/transferase [Proteobacteria bacterium]|nr:sulfatase-like hydrolase/transferase [Pseudomonadota bacterium]
MHHLSADLHDARYDFPPESAIRKPYLEDLNYTTMTRESLAEHSDELLNRYRNAANFIDTQLGRIYTALDEENLWDNTIVMMTGDHGEEFLENGFWGHNSGFSEHQLRTPMVMWIPGEQPAVFDSITSHTDVMATLMPRMGITSTLSDYTQGEPMDSTSRRDYIVASDWAGLCYLGADYKFTMPLNSSLDLVNELFTATDQPVDEVVPFLASQRETLQGILASARTFTEGNVGSDSQP